MTDSIDALKDKMVAEVVDRIGERLDEAKISGALNTLIAATILFKPKNGAVFHDLGGWQVTVMREDGEPLGKIMEKRLACIRELNEIVRQLIEDDHLWAYEEHMDVAEGKASSTVQLIVEAEEAMLTAAKLLEVKREDE